MFGIHLNILGTEKELVCDFLDATLTGQFLVSGYPISTTTTFRHRESFFQKKVAWTSIIPQDHVCYQAMMVLLLVATSQWPSITTEHMEN